MSAIGMMMPSSAATEGKVGELNGDDQMLQLHQKEELVMPRKEEKVADLSSVTATTAGAIVVTTADSKLVHWDMSMWLNSIIDFFGQQFVNYITGLSEKMEKLEYY